ncbi:Uncharacterised protein [Mycobacteroides abscessus subsp. abscessus]|nr:Uncharacterised protein [Mycobacteroides abscessus subsp. abscessus]
MTRLSPLVLGGLHKFCSALVCVFSCVFHQAIWWGAPRSYDRGGDQP